MLAEVLPYPEWKMLFDAYHESDYGTFISHEEIENIIGCTRGHKYYGLVNRWKTEMLREASRQIECLNNKGYEIINPDAFRTSAKKQLKFGHKRITKAGKIIASTPVHLLSQEEQAKLGDIGTVISQILYFSKSTLKKVKEIEKKTDQLVLDVGKALDLAD